MRVYVTSDEEKKELLKESKYIYDNFGSFECKTLMRLTPELIFVNEWMEDQPGY
jgi:hypothetical protein